MSQDLRSPSVPTEFPRRKMRPHLAPSPCPDTVLEEIIRSFVQLESVPAGADGSGNSGNFRGNFAENLSGFIWLGMPRMGAGSLPWCLLPSVTSVHLGQVRGAKGGAEGMALGIWGPKRSVAPSWPPPVKPSNWTRLGSATLSSSLCPLTLPVYRRLTNC